MVWYGDEITQSHDCFSLPGNSFEPFSKPMDFLHRSPLERQCEGTYIYLWLRRDKAILSEMELHMLPRVILDVEVLVRLSVRI